MRRVRGLLLSAGLAGLATMGFVLAVGARQDALLILLFAGFWIGLHAFLGSCGSANGSTVWHG